MSDSGISVDETVRRTAGRPRSEATSQAIVEAVIDLVAEHGSLQGFSMEAVAARSGASKATVYRRWAGRDELLAAAVEAVKTAPTDFPHESLRDDLLRLGRSVPHALSDKQHRALEVIMRESETSPSLAVLCHAAIARRREAARDMLRYWVDQGEIREGVDVAVAAAMLTSLLRSVLVFNQAPDLRTPDLVEKAVDHLLAGIAPR